mgnify:CR=1 FL=1
MSRASNSLLVSDVTATPIKLKYSSSYSNTILSSADANILKLIQPFNYTNPDFTPYASAGPATSGSLSATYGSLGLNTSLKLVTKLFLE